MSAGQRRPASGATRNEGEMFASGASRLTVLQAHLAADCPDRATCWAKDIHDAHKPAATEGAPMDDNAAYDAAKRDPVAEAVLNALHQQDAASYNGNSGNIGGLALKTAGLVRELVGKEERQRLATLLDEHRTTLTEFVDNPDKMLGLVILLLGLDKP